MHHTTVIHTTSVPTTGTTTSTTTTTTTTTTTIPVVLPPSNEVIITLGGLSTANVSINCTCYMNTIIARKCWCIIVIHPSIISIDLIFACITYTIINLFRD